MALVPRWCRSTLLALVAMLAFVPAARADEQGGATAPVTVTVNVAVGGAPAPPPAAATTPTGDASATQQAPTNVAVQVIVNSPGAVANAGQSNAASGGVAAPATPPPPTPSTPATPPTPATPSTPPAPPTPPPPPAPIPAPASPPPAAPSAPAATSHAAAETVGGVLASSAPHGFTHVRRRTPHRRSHNPAPAPRPARGPSAPVLAALEPSVPTASAATAVARRAAGSHRPHTRRAPVAPGTRTSRRPALPPPPADVGTAAGAGGPSGAGSIFLPLALLAALLLAGSAEPYELVRALRGRAPAIAGGRLERPG
jgi:hypothetical protein